MSPAAASATRDGGRLVLSGALLRPAIATLWPRLQSCRDVDAIDINAVNALDSAGLACLSLLARQHPGADLLGEPPGFPELRTAYRLDRCLAFAD